MALRRMNPFKLVDLPTDLALRLTLISFTYRLLDLGAQSIAEVALQRVDLWP